MLKTEEANDAPPDFKGKLLMAWKFIDKLIRQSEVNTKPLVFTDPAGNACLSCRWYTEVPFLIKCRLDQFRPQQPALRLPRCSLGKFALCTLHTSHFYCSVYSLGGGRLRG